MERKNKYKERMQEILDLLPVEVHSEFKFLEDRKFRFDYALVSKKIAIEYEGIYGGSKSRHTTVSGYTKDTEKYNLAAIAGWRVLRYTAKNIESLSDDLERILGGGDEQ